MPVERKLRALISTQRVGESVTTKNGIVEQVKELLPLWHQSTQRAIDLDKWYFDELDARDQPVLPNTTPEDVRALREVSSTAWAKMIVDAQSQDCVVDGLRQRESGNTAPAMELWDRNGLRSKQKAVHDAALRHGKAFNLIGEAVGRLDGARTAYIRGKSARTSDAFYRDDADEYPELFLEAVVQRDADGTEHLRVTFVDESKEHRLVVENMDWSRVQYIDYVTHNMGICPVVRFAPNLSLDGRATGEIEPYVNLFRRINQSSMQRLSVERAGAHIIRVLAGIEKPATDAEQRAARLALSVEDLLVLEDPQAKAMSFPATQLGPYIQSRESDIRDLAGVSQTPAFQMLGLSENVGAEGLAAAMHGHYLKGNLTRIAFSESWEASMRLAGFAAGKPEIAEDFQSRVDWAETRSEAFLSLVQGLGQMVQTLGIAPELVWHRIPGWTEADTQNAKKLAQAAEAKEAQKAEEELEAQKELIRAKPAAASQ